MKIRGGLFTPPATGIHDISGRLYKRRSEHMSYIAPTRNFFLQRALKTAPRAVYLSFSLSCLSLPVSHPEVGGRELSTTVPFLLKVNTTAETRFRTSPPPPPPLSR